MTSVKLSAVEKNLNFILGIFFLGCCVMDVNFCRLRQLRGLSLTPFPTLSLSSAQAFVALLLPKSLGIPYVCESRTKRPYGDLKSASLLHESTWPHFSVWG